MAQVLKWEQQWTPQRAFLLHAIQGADSVLARLRFELTQSRQFTPLRLTELMHSREYNSDGRTNLKQVERPKSEQQIRTNSAGLLVADPSPIEDTRSTASNAADALDSIAWALKWAEYATEPQIEAFII